MAPARPARAPAGQARPLTLREGGRPVAALPLYVKTHSQGEYIFDHGWAEAYERAGGRYYPKLQVAVPFTPAPAPASWGRPPTAPPSAEAAIGLAARQPAVLAARHLLHRRRGPRAGRPAGLLHRVTQQFHWENRGYASFDDFLADLSSRKRKMIRKERETAHSHGLTIRALTGDQIEPAHWEAFWAFYQDTGSRKWGRPYLTRAAFDAFHATMRDDMLLVLAFDGTASRWRAR
jgi:predicted N-acyltransferase